MSERIPGKAPQNLMITSGALELELAFVEFRWNDGLNAFVLSVIF